MSERGWFSGRGAIALLVAAAWGGLACSSSGSGATGGTDGGAAAGSTGAGGAVASGAGGTTGAAGATGAGGAGGAPTLAACPPPSAAASWTIVPIASARAPIDVVSIWADTSNDVWLAATGLHDTGTTISRDDQIQHWDGTRWTTALDAFPDHIFLATFGFGPNDVWATGDRAMHWNGSTWTENSPPANPGLISLTGGGTLRLKPVFGVASNDVWTTDVGRFFHWNGSGWTQATVTPDLANNTLNMGGIWGASSTDVWALGSFPASHPFLGILHWDGTHWTDLTGPPATGFTGEQAEVNGVWGFAANDIWAVGFSFSGSPIWHYDGTAWTHVPTPAFTGSLSAVWGLCASDVWAVGEELPGGQGTVTQEVGIVLHYDGQAWSRVDLGMTVPALLSVFGVSGDDLWVGGHAGTMVHRHL